MRKSTKIAVVLAAAALLVAGFAFTTLAKGWVKEAEGLYYYEDEYGMKVYNEWKKDGANYYYLGDDGYMVVDSLVEYNDEKYWVGADGAKVTEKWIQVPADQEDIDNYDVEYRWYYFQKTNGKAYKGVKKDIDGNTYFFGADGKMLFGYVAVDSDGKPTEMTTDVVKAYDGGTFLYYCGSNDEGKALKSEWRKETNVDSSAGAYEEESSWWAFYQSSGKKAVEKAEGYLWKGQRYYFDVNGKMITGWGEATTSFGGEDVTVSTYNGGADEGIKAKKAWKYLKPSAADSDSTDKFWFWFKADGKAVNTGAGDFSVQKINGKFYAFGKPSDSKGDNPYASKMLSGPVYLGFDGKSDVVTDATFAAKVKFSDNYSLNKWLDEGYDGVYYFSGDEANDGSLKKNVTFSQEFTDDTYTLHVGAEGKLKNGYVSKEKKYYRFGYQLKASEDMRYEVVDVYGANSKSHALLGVSGAEVTTGTVSDADGSYYYVLKQVEKVDGKDVTVSTIYKADSSQLSPAKIVSAFKNNGAKENTKVTIEGSDYYIWVDRETGYYSLTLHGSERK